MIDAIPQFLAHIFHFSLLAPYKTAPLRGSNEHRIHILRDCYIPPSPENLPSTVHLLQVLVLPDQRHCVLVLVLGVFGLRTDYELIPKGLVLELSSMILVPG